MKLTTTRMARIGGDPVFYANAVITHEARINKFYFRISGAYDKAIDCKFDSDDRKSR